MNQPVSEKALYQPLLPKPPPTKPTTKTILIHLTLLLNTLTLIYLFTTHFQLPFTHQHPQTPTSLTNIAWSHLQPHTPLLSIPPIPCTEFLTRQKTLSNVLHTQGISAYITEPSATSTYYYNLSTTYTLSERPFLQLLTPDNNLTFLAPKFEKNRIAALPFISPQEIKIIEWKEEENPYEVLKREIGEGIERVMLDEHARWMIASGLKNAGFVVEEMSLQVKSLRAVKSENEIKILRAINRFTLELIRALRKSVKVGVSQETVVQAAKNLFEKAGVGEGYWAIVLFGEGAANPHGGSKGSFLKEGEFLLLDIGSTLHGYGSDVTRTFLPDKSTVSEELMGVWKTVQKAQAMAGRFMVVNESCRGVDAVARKVIVDEGYGEFFTHRLGHGLGLEMHEHPYLNGANGEKLKIGEVVTNEPGIYVTNKQAKKMDRDVGFGVRLEDPILVTENGGEPLTGSRAMSPYEP